MQTSLASSALARPSSEWQTARSQLPIEPPHVLGVPQALQLGRPYSGSHAAFGSSPSTSDSSRTGEKGLVR